MPQHQCGFGALLHPYHLTNIALSIFFVVSKITPRICSFLYDTCSLQVQEYELLIFLGSFITLRNKRQFSIPDYFAHFCLFAKICNLIMLWRQSTSYSIVYGVFWLLQTTFLHQPAYDGPDKVLYFRDTTFEEEVLRLDSRVTWLIAFYTAWSPACIKLAPIFSELSSEYGLPNLKFGKVDVTRFPELARSQSIDTSTWSRQLPTIIIFRGGREIDRRPGISAKNKSVQKFVFSWSNIVQSFSLNNLYQECKKHPVPSTKCPQPSETKRITNNCGATVAEMEPKKEK
ncbi:unnamed protein product [Protopolystoma xenopodis]|uniref:Thioredoxin domain-containing protein n=1 Tax=Protopolystoma xenopodis TaxID=117903 RepID=A0A448X763_9PLAT|nr:unnamed protein product [Protopolystoma xenopodis]